MQRITRLGTVDDIVAGHDPAVVAMCHRLRQLIIDLDPDVVEVPRAGERTAAYGLGERKMSEAYAYLAPQRGWVNRGFYHGTLLPDPCGLIEGTGARIRHVKVRPDSVHEPPLRDLLAAARRERITALNR